MEQDELEEKVMMIEELIQDFLRRIEVIESELPEILKSFLQHYNEKLNKIAERIEKSNQGYDDQHLQDYRPR